MYKLLFKVFLLVFLFFNTFANEPAKHEDAHGAADEKFDMDAMIMHHVLDSHGWEFAHGFTIPLPVILYTKDRGVELFSSSRLDHGQTYNGYQNHHEHIVRVNEAGQVDESVHPLDFSITKNVASLMASALILILVFLSIGKSYKKNKGNAPKGLQSFLEPVILTIKDEVIKPNIGPKYAAYTPYLLTLFFFILINNLMGLTPGAANLTGNIAITLTLALFTFIIVMFKSNKNFWSHIFMPPGVPFWLLPLFWVIELIGIIVKPASLTIRLFANITGGHIIILSLLGLIFMFKSAAVGVGITLMGTFMTFVELLVAFIQAYIFTLLTSMYIGGAIEEHHEHAH